MQGSFRPVIHNLYLHRYYNFIIFMLETVKQSLHHSCGSEINRQEISLPSNRQSYSRRLSRLKVETKITTCLFFNTGQMSVFIPLFKILQKPVFLLNSRYLLFYVTFKRSSLSQSYRVNLPSSFNIIISSALVLLYLFT